MKFPSCVGNGLVRQTRKIGQDERTFLPILAGNLQLLQSGHVNPDLVQEQRVDCNALKSFMLSASIQVEFPLFSFATVSLAATFSSKFLGELSNCRATSGVRIS